MTTGFRYCTACNNPTICAFNGLDWSTPPTPPKLSRPCLAKNRGRFRIKTELISRRPTYIHNEFWNTKVLRIAEVSKTRMGKTWPYVGNFCFVRNRCVENRQRTLNKFHNDKPILSYSAWFVFSRVLCFLHSDEFVLVSGQMQQLFKNWTIVFVCLSCGHFCENPKKAEKIESRIGRESLKSYLLLILHTIIVWNDFWSGWRDNDDVCSLPPQFCTHHKSKSSVESLTEVYVVVGMSRIHHGRMMCDSQFRSEFGIYSSWSLWRFFHPWHAQSRIKSTSALGFFHTFQSKKTPHLLAEYFFSEIRSNTARTNSIKMTGRVSHFLSCLLLATLHFEGINGFQINPRPSISVVSRSRLSVATDSDSIAASVGESAGNGVDYTAYGNGYKTVFTEIPYANCEPSVGTIPSDLRGSYFRSGPGKKKEDHTAIYLWIITFNCHNRRYLTFAL